MRKTAYILIAGVLVCGMPWADQALVDGGGLGYFIATNTTSSSGGVWGATFTTSVSGTTSYGGTTSGPYWGGVDWYAPLFVNGVCYEDNGVASLENGGRQVVMNAQTIGALEVSRKVFVPDDDAFCRWLNIIMNTGTQAQNVTVYSYMNLGGDDLTRVMQTSSTVKGLAPTISDTWFVTKGYGYEPTLAHVVQGPNAPVGLAYIYQYGYYYLDYFIWQYQFTLQPGETGIIMYFMNGQGSADKAVARAQALAALQGSALDAMTNEELGQVLNFSIPSLTVSVRGIGTVDPAAGTHYYPYGTVVPVNATPGTDKAFLHWEGDSTEPLSSISLTMNGDKAVTAVFVDAPELPSGTAYTLTVEAPTAGGGTTNPVPGTYTYAGGAAVELYADAGDGYIFKNWEGDISGTTNPRSIVITSDMTVRPVFALDTGGLQCPTGAAASGQGDVGVLLLAAGALLSLGLVRRFAKQRS